MSAQHLGELMCLVTADTVHCPGHLPLTVPDTVKTVQEMPQQAGLWPTALACIQVTCGACWSTHMPTLVSKGWSPARDCIQVMVPGDTNSACLELGPSSGPLTPSSVLCLCDVLVLCYRKCQQLKVRTSFPETETVSTRGCEQGTVKAKFWG